MPNRALAAPIDPSSELDAAIAAVPEALLDDTIATLQRLSRQALADYAVAIGRTVLERFFDGSMGNFSSRAHDDGVSFNALCLRRADELRAMGLSRSTLRRYVVAYDRYRRLPHEVRQGQTLVSLEQLGKVRDPFVRGQLALQATREGWDGATLRDKVAIAVAEATPRPSGRGRPRLLPAEKALRALTRQARDVAGLRQDMAALPPARLARLRGELLAALAEVEGALAEV